MLDGLRNWWAAEPWRVVGRGRWRYWTIYRTFREGSWNPREGRWVWGAAPQGRLASLWGAVAFPHVHDDMEDFREPDAPVGVFNFRPRDGEAFRPDWTVQPAETILELLVERKMTPAELAQKMLVDLSFVLRLLMGEEPVTASVALDLEEIFGVSFDFWMNLERRYREDLARLWPGCVVDHARYPEVASLAAESGIDVTKCEFCGGPLDAEHPWRRGMDGACAHEACLTGERSDAA